MFFAWKPLQRWVTTIVQGCKCLHQKCPANFGSGFFFIGASDSNFPSSGLGVGVAACLGLLARVNSM